MRIVGTYDGLMAFTANYVVKVFVLDSSHVRCGRRAFSRQWYWARRQPALHARTVRHDRYGLLIMRRLPAERSVERLLLENQLHGWDVDALAGWMEDFTRTARRSAATGSTLLRETHRSLALQLRLLGHDVPPRLRERLDRTVRRCEPRLGSLLDGAARRGEVRLAHGDLRSTNLFLLGDGEPVAIDASSLLRGYRIPWIGHLGSFAADLRFADEPALHHRFCRATQAIEDRAELLAWYSLVKGLARWTLTSARPVETISDEHTLTAGPRAIGQLVRDVHVRFCR